MRLLSSSAPELAARAAPTAAISLIGVTRRFGSRPALTDLTMRAAAGQITVLLGPNGAGKTTAIRVITGAMSIDTGTVRTLGLDPRSDGEELRRRCGVVSAKPALYDRLSGADNLRYSAELYGLDPDKAPIREAAARFGIEGSLDQQVGGFSTGMKTRLALARSVLHDPDLLLLDEPTSGLDPESSLAVLHLIGELAQAGKTVLLCTHLLAEAEGLADQVVVLEAGSNLVSGTPAQLAQQFFPRHVVRITTVDSADSAAFDTRSIIGAAPGVLDVSLSQTGSWHIEIESPTAVPELVRYVAALGVPIQRVDPLQPTLEDVYFAVRGVERGQMTSLNNGPAGAPRDTRQGAVQ